MNRAQRATAGLCVTGGIVLLLGSLWTSRRALVEQYLLWQLDGVQTPPARIVSRLVELRSAEVVPYVLEVFERHLADRRFGSSERRFMVANINYSIREPADSVWEKHIAGQQLVTLGDLAVPGLVGLLGSDEARVRGGAARALREIGRPAVPALVEALDSEDARVLLRATHLLARLKPPPRSVPRLVELAESGSVGVRRLAVLALGRLPRGEGPGMVFFRNLSRSSERGVRELARLASARVRVLTDPEATALDRLEARILRFHVEERTVTSLMFSFLVAQFRSAQRYNNPHLDPAFEGEIFIRLFGIGPRRAPTHARAWRILLEELGCRLTASTVSRLQDISATFLRRTTEESPLYPEDDEENAATIHLGLYRDFIAEMRDLLDSNDFERLAGLFKESHFRLPESTDSGSGGG